MKITANMVTLTRISLMPLPCIALVYASEPIKWLCFFILVLLGMTDFVDGMLARRDGPTRLGALMDPVADKVFVLDKGNIIEEGNWESLMKSKGVFNEMVQKQFFIKE